MRIAILGLGLIGGSIGLAARGQPGVETVGYDPDPAALAAAVEIGAVGLAAGSVEEAVSDADLVFAAAPVSVLPRVVAAALAACPDGCVVSDVGSTKRSLLGALAGLPGAARFIGGHPLAGSERSGATHARADLFDGAIWFLTPAADAQPEALERLRALVLALGAEPVELDAAAHDRLLARVSHLPHVLANLLMSAVGGDAEEQRLAAAGPSFRDATRVAGASTEIWTDIYLANADMLIAAIDETVAGMQRVRDLLHDRDRAGLSDWNERVARQRRRVAARTAGP